MAGRLPAETSGKNTACREKSHKSEKENTNPKRK